MHSPHALANEVVEAGFAGSVPLWLNTVTCSITIGVQIKQANAPIAIPIGIPGGTQ